jgi:hypothetical protein
MAGYLIIDEPVRDRYAQAPPALLAALHRVVYPALRDDPTNTTGRFPITYQHGWYLFEVETPEGGLYHLLYQAIEDQQVVMVFDLITFREP